MSLVETAKILGLDPKKLVKKLVGSFDPRANVGYVDTASDAQLETMLKIHQETTMTEEAEVEKITKP